MFWLRLSVLIGLLGAGLAVFALGETAEGKGRGPRSHGHSRRNGHHNKRHHGRHHVQGRHQRVALHHHATGLGKGRNHRKNGNAAHAHGKNKPRRGKKLSPKAWRSVNAFAAKAAPNLTSGQQQALNNVLSGSALEAQDRASIGELLASNQSGLTPEVRQALTEALDYDTDRQQQPFVERYLRVYNNTGEKLRVWVQYRTQEESKWAWLPADPKQSDQAVNFDLEPGVAADLLHDDQHISASRVRIWAKTESGKEWLQHQEQDLWLVEERDANGEHRYLAAEEEVRTVPFPLSSGKSSLASRSRAGL